VQTCSKCYTQSPDATDNCINCQADLREFSSRAVALKRFQQNPRVNHVILSIFHDACPACEKLQGAYSKDEAPRLPIEGCSHPNGCRCFYQPVLNDIFP
jgi:hypothetical protein